MPRLPKVQPKRAADIPPSLIDSLVIRRGLVTFEEIVRRRLAARDRDRARHPETTAAGGRGLGRFGK